jgi:outer membrane protein assembly factor BamB
VVSAGDPHFPLGATATFRVDSPSTQAGSSFEHVTGLDPNTGVEKWTFYTGGASSAMTPLYNKGNLYWVAGDGQAWAINADSGAPVPAFMNSVGSPKLKLGGFNTISSANIYRQPGNKPAIMVVGKAMPDEFVGIDLNSATVLWRQTFPDTYVAGFSAVSPAVDQARGLVISTVFIGPDTTTGPVTVTAFALNAKTGAIVWTRDLATGTTPFGFVGPTPVIDNNTVYFNNPLGGAVTALDVRTGAVVWQTAVTSTPGKPSWGPGVVYQHARLIQPVGEDLLTFDALNGALLNRHHVGGAFIYNHPTVVGDTLYIGNSWGWALAMPTNTVTGGM